MGRRARAPSGWRGRRTGVTFARVGGGKRYDVFFSYSRTDEGVVEELEARLERFARPVWRRRAVRVFRDKTGLPIGSDWRNELHGAIDASENFVVVMSEASSVSEPVREELRYWVETHGTDRLFIVHLNGRLEWSETANDWTVESVVPPELRGLFTVEPGYLDLSTLTDGPAHRVQIPSSAVALLAAPIRSRDADRLLWMERHRPSRIATALTALAVCIGLLATLTYSLRQRASKITSNCDTAAPPKRARLPAFEGQLVSQTSGTGVDKWAVVIDGALWTFANEAEVRQFGYDPALATSFDVKPFERMTQESHPPPDDTLVREVHSPSGGPGRLFLIEDGMPFEISNPRDLVDVHVHLRDVRLVPSGEFGVGTPTGQPVAQPYATGRSLVRIHGRSTVWKVDGKKHWIEARRPCDGAYVPDVPQSKGVMHNLHFRSDLESRAEDGVDARPAKPNVSPDVTIACVPGNYMRHGEGTLKNLTGYAVKYRVNMSTVNASGGRTGSHNADVVTVPPHSTVPWRVVFGPRKTRGDGGHCRLRVDVLRQ
jgi:hypothetical protein